MAGNPVTEVWHALTWPEDNGCPQERHQMEAGVQNWTHVDVLCKRVVTLEKVGFALCTFLFV